MILKHNNMDPFYVVLHDTVGAELTGVTEPTIEVVKPGSSVVTLTAFVHFMWNEVDAIKTPGLYLITPYNNVFTDTLGGCYAYVKATGAEIAKCSYTVLANTEDDLSDAVASLQNLSEEIKDKVDRPYISFYAGGDTVSPVVYMVKATNKTTVDIIFSEKVLMDGSPGSALTLSNYEIPGLTINGVSKVTDSQVRLHTSTQFTGNTYNLILINIKDLEGNTIE